MKQEIERLVWNDEELSVGVKLIDEQHKKLIRIINRLQDAIEQGHLDTAFMPTLESLEDYTRTHFRMEEEFMTLFNYPEYSTQKTGHSEFEVHLQKFKVNPKESKDTLIKYLNVWLYHHIMHQDRKLGEYLNSIGVK